MESEYTPKFQLWSHFCAVFYRQLGYIKIKHLLQVGAYQLMLFRPYKRKGNCSGFKFVFGESLSWTLVDSEIDVLVVSCKQWSISKINFSVERDSMDTSKESWWTIEIRWLYYHLEVRYPYQGLTHILYFHYHNIVLYFIYQTYSHHDVSLHFNYPLMCRVSMIKKKSCSWNVTSIEI